MLDRSEPGGGNGPVVVMVHGYKYKPGDARHCPHRHVMALQPDDLPYRSPSWPRQLGFGAGHAEEGLAIAFGWQARGAIWAARNRAVAAGRALADVVAALQARTPNRPVHMMAHSMGIETCLEALHHLQPGAVQRIISMTGASYHTRVHEALQTPAGETVEFFNIVSRENDLFEAMYEWLIAPPVRGDRAIGKRLDSPNAVTVQIDCPDTLDVLARFGQPLGRPERRVCHWSAYTRPGILRFYNALLRRPDLFPLEALKRDLPGQTTPRWSRLLSLPDLRPAYGLPERAW